MQGIHMFNQERASFSRNESATALAPSGQIPHCPANISSRFDNTKIELPEPMICSQSLCQCGRSHVADVVVAYGSDVTTEELIHK